VAGSEKRAHADKGERAGVNREMSQNVLCAVIEKKTKAGANEKRWRENAANRAGAKRRGCSKDFENKDDGDRLPDPFAAQHPTYGTVTVAADFWVEYGQRAYDETARAHLDVDRRGDAACPFFA